LNPVFQYLAATIIVILALSFTLYAVASTVFTQLNTNSQYQLYPVAEQLMQSFLLNPGLPYDWGENTSILANNLTYFGLSTAPGSTLTYSLDPSKLNRIANLPSINSKLYIPPNVTGALLGIYQKDHYNYGFSFLMVPALNITITNTTQNKYLIYVSDYSGVPAINAQVNVSYFAFCEAGKRSSQLQFYYNYTKSYNVTNLFGQTQVSLTKPSLPSICYQSNNHYSYLVMADASYYGIQFQNILSAGVCKANMLIQGQYLLANFVPQNKTGNCFPVNPSQGNGNGNGNNGSVHVDDKYTIFEVTSSLNVVINPSASVICSNGNNQSQLGCSVLNNGNFNNAVVRMKYPISPSVVFAGLIITTNGRDYFIIASNPVTNPYGYINYSSDNLTTLPSFSQGLVNANVNSAVTVTRFVNVGQNTWYASLTVWRMGQS
jgi:hypothetical protein